MWKNAISFSNVNYISSIQCLYAAIICCMGYCDLKGIALLLVIIFLYMWMWILSFISWPPLPQWKLPPSTHQLVRWAPDLFTSIHIWGVGLTTHPFLVPRLSTDRAIPLPPLCLRANLDFLGKRNIFFSCQESDPKTSDQQIGHYTKWSTQVPWYCNIVFSCADHLSCAASRWCSVCQDPWRTQENCQLPSAFLWCQGGVPITDYKGGAVAEWPQQEALSSCAVSFWLSTLCSWRLHCLGYEAVSLSEWLQFGRNAVTPSSRVKSSKRNHLPIVASSYHRRMGSVSLLLPLL